MVRLKAASSFLESVGLPEFQFLMVRLKDPGNSIRRLQPTFQFLMVRLKVFIKNNFTIFNKFQFLMVRLKGVKDIKKEGKENHFNSLWFD